MAVKKGEAGVDKKITFRLPEDVYSGVAALAEKDRRSVASELIVLLEEAVSARVARSVSASQVPVPRVVSEEEGLAGWLAPREEGATAGNIHPSSVPLRAARMGTKVGNS
jgi:hypothetical protein